MNFEIHTIGRCKNCHKFFNYKRMITIKWQCPHCNISFKEGKGCPAKLSSEFQDGHSPFMMEEPIFIELSGLFPDCV